MKFSDVISPGFSTAQVARLTGLTPRQLDHWDRKGFLKPSLREAQGYGSTRRYSFATTRGFLISTKRLTGAALATISWTAGGSAWLH